MSPKNTPIGFKRQGTLLCLFCWLLIIPVSAAAPPQWEVEQFGELCLRYLGEQPPADAAEAEHARWLDRLTRSLGQRLVASGTTEVSSRDIALLALFHGQNKPPAPLAAGTSVQEEEQSIEQAVEQAQMTLPEEAQTEDVGKGEEGLARALEKLEELPVSELMVITGDVTAGTQGANVPDAPSLGSIFGRARVNFTLRAPSRDEQREEGRFFVQMVSAGGAFDSSPVGGPRSFSAFNDVATDRSEFNSSKLKGNLFLNKAFYEQGFGFANGRLVARAGLLSMSDYFDTNNFANNEARQFLNSGFVNSVGYKTGGTAPGLVGEYHRPLGGDWLEGMVVRLGSAFSRTDRAFSSPFWTGEVELQTRWMGHTGNWRLGTTVGHVAGSGAVEGFHFSMDHWIRANVGLFGRYAISNSGAGSLVFGPVRQSYSGGVQWLFADEQERVSAWAIAFGQAFPIITEEALGSEKVLETYYRWQISRNFAISPDFQLVFGSGGRTSSGTQAVLGLRTHFGF